MQVDRSAVGKRPHLAHSPKWHALRWVLMTLVQWQMGVYLCKHLPVAEWLQRCTHTCSPLCCICVPVPVLGLVVGGVVDLEGCCDALSPHCQGMMASLSCFSPTPGHTLAPRHLGKGHKSDWQPEFTVSCVTFWWSSPYNQPSQGWEFTASC